MILNPPVEFRQYQKLQIPKIALLATSRSINSLLFNSAFAFSQCKTGTDIIFVAGKYFRINDCSSSISWNVEYH